MAPPPETGDGIGGGDAPGPGPDEAPRTLAAALDELARLRLELTETREIVRAIGAGEVDAFVVADGTGTESVFTLTTADGPYRRFVENMRDGAATVAENGLVLYANGCLAEMLGRPREAIVGSSITSFTEPGVPIPWGVLARSGATVAVDLVDGDGERVPALVGASALDAEGIQVTCLTFSDLTWQQAQEDEIARLTQAQLAAGLRFTAVVETLQEGVLVQDDQGRVLEANRTAAEILRMPRDTLVTDPPTVLSWSPTTARDPTSTPGRRALRDGEPQLGEMVGVERDGAQVWLEINSVPLLLPGESEAPVVISSFRDVTERVVADEAIRFQAVLLDTAGQAIIAVDVDGMIVYWNKHAEHLYGWLAHEATGRSITDLILPPETVAEGEDMFARMTAGETWASDHWVTRRDGTRFPVFATSTPLLGDDGALVAMISVATDITDRREAEDRARRLSAIVESSSDAIVGMSLDRIITSWNPGAAALFGYDAAEAVGHHVSMLAPSLADDADLNRLASVHELSISNLETRFLTKDGAEVTISLSLSPILDEHGRPTGVSGIGRDITQLKALERRAEANRHELQVAQHEAELAAIARREADRANMAKSEFLSRMSHELRTPLNAVLGFAQVLLMQDLSAGQRESVGFIRAGGEHLLDLITDVMEISRIEAGSLDLTPESVRLEDVVASALNLVIPQAAQQQIELPPSGAAGDLHVLADRQRVLQVLLNLLSNAVKYNRRGGHIELTCTTSGPFVSVAVSDTGIGISDSDQRKLFTPFERLGAEATQIEGTGVGLALSHALAHQMGGSITATSVLGRGSTFTLLLPAAPAPAAAGTVDGPVAGSEPRAGARPLVLLVVEDNVANVRLMERALERLDNITMHGATSGHQGLQLAAQHPPDLILLDLHLPDQDGASVLRRLRSDPRTAATPVFICSADASPGHRDRLLAQGASAYLTKPLDLAELYVLIEQVRAGEAPTQHPGRAGATPRSP